jgi:hypothetical protein
MKDENGPGRQTSGAFFMVPRRMAGVSMSGSQAQVCVPGFKEALQVVLQRAAVE